MLACQNIVCALGFALAAWQATIFDYYLVACNSYFPLFCVIFDVFVWLYMVLFSSVDQAAENGIRQWRFYSYALAFKVLVFYYIVIPETRLIDRREEHLNLIFGALLVTPVIYTILSFRATRQLYRRSRDLITIERLFHYHTVWLCVVDYLDLATISIDMVRLIVVEEGKEAPWSKRVMGLFVVLGYFLHSESFVGISKKELQYLRRTKMRKKIKVEDYVNRQIEMTAMRTFVACAGSAFVSIFVIQIPIIVMRFQLEIYSDTYNFNFFFILKSIIQVMARLRTLFSVHRALGAKYRARIPFLGKKQEVKEIVEKKDVILTTLSDFNDLFFHDFVVDQERYEKEKVRSIEPEDTRDELVKTGFRGFLQRLRNLYQMLFSKRNPLISLILIFLTFAFGYIMGHVFREYELVPEKNLKARLCSNIAFTSILNTSLSIISSLRFDNL